MDAASGLTAVRPDGSNRPVARPFAPEVPVALEYNGLSYAVMMASPSDLEDFVIGFALTKPLALSAGDVTGIDITPTALGWIARATILSLPMEKLAERCAHACRRSSCGLCGIEQSRGGGAAPSSGCRARSHRPLPRSSAPLPPCAIISPATRPPAACMRQPTARHPA